VRQLPSRNRRLSVKLKRPWPKSKKSLWKRKGTICCCRKLKSLEPKTRRILTKLRTSMLEQEIMTMTGLQKIMKKALTLTWKKNTKNKKNMEAEAKQTKRKRKIKMKRKKKMMMMMTIERKKEGGMKELTVSN
jgi:hypothetical protein